MFQIIDWLRMATGVSACFVGGYSLTRGYLSRSDGESTNWYALSAALFAFAGVVL